MNFEQLPETLQPLIERYWQQLVANEQVESEQEAEPRAGGISLSELVSTNPELAAELALVWAASDYAANLCIRDPELLIGLYESGELERRHKSDFQEQLKRLLAPLQEQTFAEAESLLKREIRRFQKAQMLRIVWRDVCRKAELPEVCADMSALADACLDCSLELLHHWAIRQWGEPLAEQRPQSMVIIGMGKLGANELNVSSDIDLIFTYPMSGETTGDGSQNESITNQQYFVRLGQRLIDVLDTMTSDGFVFRVDMRLRPYGSEGALVCSFDAMENYYQNQGREWERYALIKARTVAGDREQGSRLLARLKPFVYRRYLDFSAFESLRAMKLQINRQVRRRQELDQDIKLGSGGIREIEFIVQALQLVHGGRDPGLQEPSLLKVLAYMDVNDYLPAATVAELVAAYTFLRNLEHKLQGIANQQTQTLSTDSVECQRIALAMGFDTWSQLIGELNRHRQIVRDHFEAVIHTDEDEAAVLDEDDTDWNGIWRQHLDEAGALEQLEEQGFESPAETLGLLQAFRKEKTFLTLGTESRNRFDRFMPLLLQAVAHSDKPSLAFSRVLKLIAAVSRRTAYLVLLLENPKALQEVVLLCTASPFITEFLSKYPVLLDELLGGIDRPPERSALQQELEQQLLRIDDDNFEEQMEFLRYFRQSHTLQVAAAQITGRLTVMKVSDYLTFLAEAILEQVLALSWRHLTHKHGFPVRTAQADEEGGQQASGEAGELDFVIVAYGKLGGYELGYGSDLDLVFLHEGALDQDTVAAPGQRSINSRELYTRLAQRIILMLGTYTMSGKLYEVDMRLRPSGESGLLVSSIDAFANYQTREAWTWEHQALVRARCVAGSKRLMEKFARLRADVLSQPRELPALTREVGRMRQRMREELQKKAPAEAAKQSEKLIFSLKQGQGGIVDIEFIVQYLVLAESGQCPDLLTYTDNFRILEAASGCGLAAERDINLLTTAYLALRSAMHQLSLQQDESIIAGEDLTDCRGGVREIWTNFFGP